MEHHQNTDLKVVEGIFEACKEGKENELRSLLKRYPHLIEVVDKNGKNLLHFCCENRNTGPADHLLHKNPGFLKAQDNDGYSALHLSVINGNIPLTRLLLNKAKTLLSPAEFEAFINCLDSEKHTAAHWAVVSGQIECLDLLIENEANLAVPDIHGAHPIHYAAQMCGPYGKLNNSSSDLGPAILNRLLDLPDLNIHCIDNDKRTPLLWAASSGL